ncbi:GNAT family N-acetyltransferase [Haloglomus litoreum]|uniref:GNAT family N-acetyltransferase n=1 Tax=Haloglomus litoreum TaxID=3034026 RepID=UPI0023E8E3AE|nr:GNAT family N-acetyltransferase [Haloglomus sp. DT116]
MTDRAAAPSDVLVERGETADAEAVADCWVALATDQQDHGSRLHAARNRSAAREAALRHAVTGGLFVARRVEGTAESDRAADTDGGGSLLGFVTASRATGDFVETADRGVVRNIYVRPAERGRGIGTALLRAAESHLAEQGVSVVSLEVMAANEAARRFYRRHGYEDHRVELQRTIDDG